MDMGKSAVKVHKGTDSLIASRSGSCIMEDNDDQSTATTVVCFAGDRSA